jgi:hypothetical protein
VNFNMTLAQLVVPDRPWCILTSDRHSTCYDGKDTLFDFNFCALGIPAEEAYELATEGPNAEQLAPGKLLQTYLAGDWQKWRGD